MTSHDDELTDEFRRRVAGLGFELVDLRLRGAGRRTSVQVRIDRPDSVPGSGVTTDDCAAVSRTIEKWLDRSEQLGSRYVLEVSSPGIERPIRWFEHWTRFVGEDVRVKIADRGRLRATIVRTVAPDRVVLRPLEGPSDEIEIPVGEAREATLIVDWSELEKRRKRFVKENT